MKRDTSKAFSTVSPPECWTITYRDAMNIPREHSMTKVIKDIAKMFRRKTERETNIAAVVGPVGMEREPAYGLGTGCGCGRVGVCVCVCVCGRCSVKPALRQRWGPGEWSACPRMGRVRAVSVVHACVWMYACVCVWVNARVSMSGWVGGWA